MTNGLEFFVWGYTVFGLGFGLGLGLVCGCAGAEMVDICLPIEATEMCGRYECGNWILLCFFFFFFCICPGL